MSTFSVDRIARNGRSLGKGDPLIDAIKAKYAACRETGEAYPILHADDFGEHPHVWWGRRCYHAETLAAIMPSKEARHAPVPLPDHHQLTGDERLPGETKRQREKYLVYRSLGPERTLAAVGRVVGTPDSGGGGASLHALATRFRWNERCAAWDAGIALEARRAQRAVIEEQLVEHVDERQKYLDREIKLVSLGLDRLEEMLALPIVHTVEYRDEDGRVVEIHHHPARWGYDAVAKMIEQLGKFGRLHHGLSTSNASQKIENSGTLRVEASVMGQQDSRNMSPEEREAHQFAARAAENAYFNALAEYRSRAATPAARIVESTASEAADG